MKRILFLFIIFSFLNAQAQLDEDQLGAWYMLFWNTSFGESEWGAQGDVQFRNWDLGGDLEQLLLRGGITYAPIDAGVKFTLGYGHISTGAFGNSDAKVFEHRIYQEALIPHKVGERFHLTHRFRFEQRYVENLWHNFDFRTRYRYNLFLNVPLNSKNIEEKTIYLALYNELFINGQKEFGFMRTVEIFDRNRFYSALGYAIKKNLRMQLGIMRQSTDSWTKQQIQLSLHAKF